MRKVLFGILTTISLIFCATPCLAETEGNIFVGSDEADEIMEDIEIILDDVASFNIYREDIKLDNIVRDYICIDVLKTNITSAEEMRECLKDARYIYCLPIHKNGNNYNLMISEGPELRAGAELTEEEIEYVISRIGKWGVPVVGVIDENDAYCKDYRVRMETFLRCYNINNSENFFVGGLTWLSPVTGICFPQDDENMQNGPYYVLMDLVDENAQTADGIADAVLTYDEIKEIAYADQSNGGTGGGISSRAQMITNVIFPGFLIVVIVVVIMVIQKRAEKRGR